MPPFRNSFCFNVFTFILILALAPARLRAAAETIAVESQEDAMKRKVYASIARDDEKGFTRMAPPKPGEWLSTHPEAPQSLERYIMSARIRPTKERRTIVLQPLGEMNKEQTRLIEALREYAEIFFQLPARVELPRELKPDPEIKNLTRKVPISLRRGLYETQYNADVILDKMLIKSVPADAAVCLGITMEDLYSGDLNYVFGLGSMAQRVGVYSLCRYFPEFWNQTRQPGAETLALRRACKVLNHETGHMFGMSHCIFYNCSMNGSNSLQETDAAPIHFCPVCHRKLLWNSGFEPEKRFAALQAFYDKHGLKEEAAFMAERLKNWRKTVEMENAKKRKDE